MRYRLVVGKYRATSDVDDRGSGRGQTLIIKIALHAVRIALFLRKLQAYILYCCFPKKRQLTVRGMSIWKLRPLHQLNVINCISRKQETEDNIERMCSEWYHYHAESTVREGSLHVSWLEKNSQVGRTNVQIKAAAVRNPTAVCRVDLIRLFGGNCQSWWGCFWWFSLPTTQCSFLIWAAWIGSSFRVAGLLVRNCLYTLFTKYYRIISVTRRWGYRVPYLMIVTSRPEPKFWTRCQSVREALTSLQAIT